MRNYSSLLWPPVSRLAAMTFVPGRVRVGVLRLFGADIGRGVLIRPRVRIRAPRRLSVGTDSWIGEAVELDCRRAPIVIGSDVVLSQAARLIAAQPGPLIVDDGAWIALRATVTGSVRVGRRAVVGAGARIDREVAPHALVRSPAAIAAPSLTQRP
ncbi:MAG: acetyltransferase [Gordonia sp. (in: high G+C Gram-positive bacteria)]|uniref:acetyltransferase n=1 Tax=Gordonia TaxID=2053 RepID=UPI0032673044